MADLGAIVDVPDRLSIAARRPGALVEVALWHDHAASAVAALAALLGTRVPQAGQLASVSGTRSAFRIAPRRYWWYDDTPSPLFETIAQQVTDAHGSVSDLSHACTIAEVAGLNAEALLTRLTPVDVRGAVFPVGAFAQTFVHDANVLLRRMGDTAFAIFAPTTFADSLADTLRHAANLMHQDANGDAS